MRIKKKKLERESEQNIEGEEKEDIQYIPVNENMYKSKEILEKIKDLTKQGKHVEAQAI